MAKDEKSQQAGRQAAAPQQGPNQPAADNRDETKSVWTKDEIEQQIRRIDHELSVAVKQRASETNAKAVEEQLDSAIDSYSLDKLVTTEETLIEAKGRLIELVNGLNPWRRFAWFVSIWGTAPISCGIAGVILSSYFLSRSGTYAIMGVVPIWACLVAVMGASVQILVGVVKDYKTDHMITDYKRLWYFVIIPVSFAFGFVAFLLIQAGLITVSQGTFVINPINETVVSTVTNQTASGGAVTQITTSTTYGLAFPMILCFLAGYATDWFMGLLGKITSTSESGTSSQT
jgi:hypothetical protein